MLEFEYEIERDERSEILKLAPDIITSPFKSTTSYVEGPNSSGKTTLLHLIALGCHGLQGKKNLPTSLRGKLTDLAKNDEITFDIKVYDEANKLILRTRKKDKDRDDIETFHDVGEGLQRIASDQFSLRYELIYDIPENPGERIDLLSEEVKDLQTTINNSIGDFKYSLRDTIKILREGRNPKIMKELQTKIEGGETDVIFKKQQLAMDKEKLDLVRTYVYSKFHEKYRLSNASATRDLKKLESIPDTKKKAKSYKKSAYTKAKKQAEPYIKCVVDNYREAGEFLRVLFRRGKEKDWYNEIWVPFNIEDLRDEHRFPARFGDVLDNFIDKCDEIFEVNKERGKTSAVYEELIRVLKEASKLKLEMPVIGDKIPDLIKEIEKINKGNVQEARRAENAESASTVLNNLRGAKWTLDSEYLSKLKTLQKEEKDEPGSIDDNTQYRTKLAELRARCSHEDSKETHYNKKLLEYGIQANAHCDLVRDSKKKSEIETYLDYTEDQLISEIKGLEKTLGISKEQHSYAKLLLRNHSKDFDRLNKKKPHKYESKREIIENTLERNLSDLEVKMRNFSGYLTSYREKKPLPKKENLPKDHGTMKNYYESVSNYLGFKLGTMRHGPKGDEYLVTKVDLHRGIIETKSGRGFRITAMGTGQSQATYLLARLNRDYGKRKLIVLFDEVSMMDNASLKPIIDKINTFKKEGKLIIGLVVQKREEGPKITPLEEW